MSSSPPALPRPLWALLAVYTAASLLHFVHNAEFIAIYPNLPRWITRETVYLSWLAVCLPGLAGALLWRLRWRRGGALLWAVFGALGLAGLLHYTLALCGEHTLVTNLTIWFESCAGALLALAALRYARARGRFRPAADTSAPRCGRPRPALPAAGPGRPVGPRNKRQ